MSFYVLYLKKKKKMLQNPKELYITLKLLLRVYSIQMELADQNVLI